MLQLQVPRCDRPSRTNVWSRSALEGHGLSLPQAQAHALLTTAGMECSAKASPCQLMLPPSQCMRICMHLCRLRYVWRGQGVGMAQGSSLLGRPHHGMHHAPCTHARSVNRQCVLHVGSRINACSQSACRPCGTPNCPKGRAYMPHHGPWQLQQHTTVYAGMVGASVVCPAACLLLGSLTGRHRHWVHARTE
jgi:hypothetical protein